MAPPRLPPEIINFNRVRTVYVRRFQTVLVKLRRVTTSHVLTTMGVPLAIEEVLRTVYNQLDDEQEHFVILVLNAAREMVGYKVVASGTLHAVAVDTPLVFRNAILLGARAIVCAHNHPLGDLDPSPSDVELTEHLIGAGNYLNIELVDHYIVTARACSSMKERLPHLWPADTQTKRPKREKPTKPSPKTSKDRKRAPKKQPPLAPKKKT
jgi:DNA repair protein RadC